MLEELTPSDLDRVAALEVGAYIINFYSTTCGPCATMKPVLESLSRHNPNVRIYRINAGEHPELAQKFDVRGVPAIFFCEGREVIYSVAGVISEFELQRVLNAWDDVSFREYGELPPIKKHTDYTFVLVVTAIVLVFIVAIVLL